MNTVLVSVIMTSYNHEQYIRNAIEGVIKQKTTFSYELLIHDDASKDNTVEIIKEYEKEYPNIIKAIYQSENQTQQGKSIIFDFILPKVSGKYVAICEGDDFWIDEYKLQKQISFLEEHVDYSMSMHNAWKWDVATDTKKEMNTFPSSGTYSLEEQVAIGLGTNFPATASYVMRTECLKSMPKHIRESFVLDYPMRVFCASKGKIYYFEDIMSVYRYASSGSFTERIQKSPEAYFNYVSEMLKLYKQLNILTNFLCNEIYCKKIQSDCLGLAVLIVQNRISKALMDLMPAEEKKMTLSFVDYLSDINSNVRVAKFFDENQSVWIYGTSNLGKLVYQQVVDCGYNVDGFVVSDGYTKLDTFCDKKVEYLSSVVQQKENPGFILAVQPINEKDIISGILNCGNYSYLKIFD